MSTDEPTRSAADGGPLATNVARPGARAGTARLGESGPGEAPAVGDGLAHQQTQLPAAGAAPPRARTDTPDPLAGAVIAERYRLSRRVGEGGMGAVYAGEHLTLRKRVAVKFLHAELSRVPEVVARFEREAIAAANLEHPNVVAAHDFGKTADGQFFLVMEFVEGGSLRDLLETEGRLPPLRALHIGRHIGNALARAHRLQIVHRDLKPENVVLVEREGDRDFAKVIDFGIAKVAAGRLAGGALTQAGMVFGTPDYMAPEQALGANVDHRADLYAFGVMLFEMFTGQRPFEAEDVMVLLGKHMTAPPPAATSIAPAGALPTSLDPVFARMLAKSPGERFQSVTEAIQALELALGATPQGVVGTPPLGITAPAPTPIESPERSGSMPSLVFGTAQSFPEIAFDSQALAPVGVAPATSTAAPAAAATATPATTPAASPTSTLTPAAAPALRRAFDTLITGYRELRRDRPRHRLVVGGVAAIALVAVVGGLAMHRSAPVPAALPPHAVPRPASTPVPPAVAPPPPSSVPGGASTAPPREALTPVHAPPSLGPPEPASPPAEHRPSASATGMPADLALELATYRARPEVAPLLAARGARRRASIAAFEQIRVGAPADPIVLYLLGTLYAQDRRTLGTAAERYGEAVRVRAGFARDEALMRDVVRAFVAAGRPSPAAEALLAGALAMSAGPYLLDVLMNSRVGAARNRATAMLLSPAYNDFADDTVRGLIALSRARSCEDRISPVETLGRRGDERALPYLRRIRTGTGCGIFGLEACNGCLTEALPVAISAIESRVH